MKRQSVPQSDLPRLLHSYGTAHFANLSSLQFTTDCAILWGLLRPIIINHLEINRILHWGTLSISSVFLHREFTLSSDKFPVHANEPPLWTQPKLYILSKILIWRILISFCLSYGRSYISSELQRTLLFYRTLRCYHFRHTHTHTYV